MRRTRRAGEEEVMEDGERERWRREEKREREREVEEEEVVVMDKASCVSKPRVVSMVMEVEVVYGREWREFFLAQPVGKVRCVKW